MNISPEGVLTTLPLLLKNYTPHYGKLPSFIRRLGRNVILYNLPLIMHTDFPPQVDWFLEKPCFESFLKELALFYTPEPLAPDETLDARGEYLSKVIEIVLFPELKRRFIAVRGLVTEKRVVEVADLPGLYRIFERC